MSEWNSTSWHNRKNGETEFDVPVTNNLRGSKIDDRTVKVQMRMCKDVNDYVRTKVYGSYMRWEQLLKMTLLEALSR